MVNDEEKAKTNFKKELMSRSKKRVFDKMWETYTSAFKMYYKSLGQKAKTRLVNSSIVMHDGRYVSEVVERYQMEERLKRSRERENTLGTEGVIQEVAEVHGSVDERLGSQQNWQFFEIRLACVFSSVSTLTNKPLIFVVVLPISLQVMVGGPLKLKAAVERGAIRTQNIKGVQLFVFPNTATNITDKHTSEMASIGKMASAEETCMT